MGLERGRLVLLLPSTHPPAHKNIDTTFSLSKALFWCRNTKLSGYNNVLIFYSHFLLLHNQLPWVQKLKLLHIYYLTASVGQVPAQVRRALFLSLSPAYKEDIGPAAFSSEHWTREDSPGSSFKSLEEFTSFVCVRAPASYWLWTRRSWWPQRVSYHVAFSSDSSPVIICFLKDRRVMFSNSFLKQSLI